MFVETRGHKQVVCIRRDDWGYCLVLTIVNDTASGVNITSVNIIIAKSTLIDCVFAVQYTVTVNCQTLAINAKTFSSVSLNVNSE